MSKFKGTGVETQLDRVIRLNREYQANLAKKDPYVIISVSYTTSQIQEFVNQLEDMEPEDLEGLENVDNPLNKFMGYITSLDVDHVNMETVSDFLASL